MGTRNNKAPAIQSDSTLPKYRAEVVRQQIQATKLVQRWQSIALGELVGDPQVLAVQERAIKGLLNKVVPDRSAVEMTGGDGAGAALIITVNQVK